MTSTPPKDATQKELKVNTCSICLLFMTKWCNSERIESPSPFETAWERYIELGCNSERIERWGPCARWCAGSPSWCNSERIERVPTSASATLNVSSTDATQKELKVDSHISLLSTRILAMMQLRKNWKSRVRGSCRRHISSDATQKELKGRYTLIISFSIFRGMQLRKNWKRATSGWASPTARCRCNSERIESEHPEARPLGFFRYWCNSERIESVSANCISTSFSGNGCNSERIERKQKISWPRQGGGGRCNSERIESNCEWDPHREPWNLRDATQKELKDQKTLFVPLRVNGNMRCNSERIKRAE